jgi:hypothetical protein
MIFINRHLLADLTGLHARAVVHKKVAKLPIG